MTNGVVVLNGFGEHGDTMALYVAGKLITTATIDGSKEGHSGKVYDFLGEFGVGPKEAGITDIDVLDQDPDLTTDYRPCAQMDDLTDEQCAALDKLEAAGTIDENGCYEFVENLSDITPGIFELQE